MNINDYEFNLPPSIKDLLNHYQPYFLPAKNRVFYALELTNFYDVKVVFLGQDPYPNKKDAMGLSFSVEHTDIPKSLQNILLSLKQDLNINKTNGDLTSWAQQGVLLLNSILTYDQHDPKAHHHIGWEQVTDQIITNLSNRGRVIFVLLGNKAIAKKNLINQQTNTIICAPHPSPLSAYRGFFDAHIFKQINQALTKYHYPTIDWH